MGRVLQPFEYYEPNSLDEAIRLSREPGSKLIAGGCDLVLSLRRAQVHYDRLISVMKLPGLDTFSAHPKSGIEIGAKIKISRLACDIWVSKRFGALHEAIDQLHPPHIRNMGTLVGNVCSAVAYTDIPPSLMALRAEVRVLGPNGTRSVRLDEFYNGPRHTVLAPGEIVTSIFVPPPAPSANSAFRKIYKAPRREGDLHKVNAAAYVALDPKTETIVDATVVVGCCGYAAYRVSAAETALKGAPALSDSYAKAGDIAAASIKPMTDAAWVEETRQQFVRVLVRDTLEQAAARARAKHDPFEHADELLNEAGQR